MKVDYKHRGKYEARVLEISLNGKKFSTPTYFPSISSATSRRSLESLIAVCSNVNYPRLLVSAYDLYHTQNLEKTSALLKKYTAKNVLFLDSGGFEGYWLQNKSWSYSKYKKIVKTIPGDLYAGFDKIPEPGLTDQDIATHVFRSTKKSSKLTQTSHCITVSHGNSPDQLINTIEILAKKHNELLSMISVPERECGKTLEEKIKTIIKIRKILSRENPANYLHILGCGSPVSMALFSFAGADSFDSGDWSRWLINPKTMQFLAHDHLPMIDCPCEICERDITSPLLKSILHNLRFYKLFMDSLRATILKNDGFEFLSHFLGQKSISSINNFFKTHLGKDLQ